MDHKPSCAQHHDLEKRSAFDLELVNNKQCEDKLNQNECNRTELSGPVRRINYRAHTKLSVTKDLGGSPNSSFYKPNQRAMMFLCISEVPE